LGGITGPPLGWTAPSEPVDSLLQDAELMPQQEDIGLHQYVEILWRRRWVIFSVFIVVFSLSSVWVSMTRTSYRVRSLVALKNQLYNRERLLPFAPGSDRPEQSLYGESYAQIINGLPFAEKVSMTLVRRSGTRSYVPEDILASIRAEFQDPDLILIYAQHVDPNLAMELANAAADTFVEESVASLKASILSYSDHALAQMEQYESQMRQAEEEIARFKESLGFVNIDDEISNLKNTISEFEKEAAVVQTQIEIAVTHRVDIRSLVKVSGSGSGSILVDEPQVEQLRNLQDQLTQARLRYTDQHPAVRNLENQIRGIESRLTASLESSGSTLSPERYLSLRNELSETEAKLADLQTARLSWDKQIAGVRAQLSDFPEKKFQLEQIERRAEQARQQYLSWREKVDDANSQASTVQGNASVADYASSPEPAVRKSNLLALGFLVAALLGVGLGLVVEFADSTVRTPEEITRAVGLGFLGSIIRLKEPRQIVFSGGTSTENVSEAYTKIYSNLKFSAVEGPMRSILITSARKGEGKSTSLMNLACAIAASGKRVIVVDTDLRNPSLQRILKIRHQTGVTNVLAGECIVDDAIKATVHPGVSILPSGPIPPNPAELLQSSLMKQLIEDLEVRCDIVIFDSPPTLLVADAMLLAAEVDAAVIVTEAGGVTRKEVQHVRDTLQMARARILGVILNKVAEVPGAYYYNYYSYYHSYKDQDQDEPAEPAGALGWLRGSVKSLNSKIGGRT